MKTKDFSIFCLGWLATNTPLLVQLLQALLPVLAVCALGYAIHVIARDKGKRK